MKPESNSPFFDKNTFIAIVLSFAVFFMWQIYVSKKYPQQEVVAAVTPDEAKKSSETQSTETPAATISPLNINTQNITPIADQTLTFKSDEAEIQISNKGMGFKQLKLNLNKDRSGQPIQYLAQDETQSIAETRVNGAPVLFQMSAVSSNQFVGLGQVDQIQIKKTLNFDPKKYLVTIKTETVSPERKSVTINHRLVDAVHPVSSSFLLPSYEHQEFFVLEPNGKVRQVLNPTEAVTLQKDNVSMASLNSHYFALALLNKSDLLPQISAQMNSQTAMATLDFVYKSTEATDRFETQTEFFFGPKDMELLKAVDTQLTDIIDFGFFSFIGKPLLATLKFIFSFIKNWGVAIILLTILLRMILLPMNLYSFKAMKRMQKVQPRLKEIKEKYKSDPQRMNQETLKVMRDEKANPVSGCLPMLMQIPIFFALYQVLGKSIELYQAPFALWISDLSLKDPWFVLPILVGLTFFIQQKITPTASMDPAQQKVLLFMPLVFSVFMLSVPSGLTLYMFVNSLFGIIQQLIFTRQTTA